MSYDEGLSTRNTTEGNLVRDILYASRENVNFVHEVYRQAFLLSFRYLLNILWLSLSKIGELTKYILFVTVLMCLIIIYLK